MSIASRITSIEEHIENAYDRIEDLGIDLTNVDKNIDNIATELEAIYNDYPKVTASNVEETSLSNTNKGRMEIGEKGNTSQYTTTGKNLLPNNQPTSVTLNSVTITKNSDGSLSLTGTSSADIYYYIQGSASSTPFQLLAGTYTLSGGKSSNIFLRLAKSGESHDNVGTPTTFTINSDTSYYCYLRVKANVTTNITIYPMIEEGSTATDYEPYTGGIPSPNPNYKQTIHTVNGSNTLKIQNKNLFDGDSVTFIDGYLNDNGVQTSSASTHYTNNYFKIKSSTNYTISGTLNTSSAAYRIYFYNKDKEWLSRSAAKDGNSTFETPSNCEYIRLQVPISITLNTGDVQLEIGNSASTYTAHQEQNLPINLASKNLLDIEEILKSLSTYTKNQDGSYTFTPNTNSYSSGFKVSLPYDSIYTYKITNGTGVNFRFRFVYDDDSVADGSGNGTGETEVSISASPSQIHGNIKEIRFNWTTKGTFTIKEVMLNKGSTAETYTPYYNYELCKIGTAQDYFYKDSGKWYVHKENYNIDLSTLTWTLVATNLYRSASITNIKVPASTSDVPNLLAEKYKARKQGGNFSNGEIAVMGGTYSGCLLAQDETGSPSGLAKYELATPTNIEITQTSLINQLEAVAKSYNETTNISQTNNGLPFKLDLSALRGE